MSELFTVLLDFLGAIITWGRSLWKEDGEEHGLD